MSALVIVVVFAALGWVFWHWPAVDPSDTDPIARAVRARDALARTVARCRNPEES